jgi:hypothetical protein
VKLRIYRKLPRTILTIHGKLSFTRTALIPSTTPGFNDLSELGVGKHVFPLDEIIGISNLPFKMSVGAMLEVSFWVQGSSSYEAAARILARDTGININYDTAREVASHVGRLVFENDKEEADKSSLLLHSERLSFPKEKKEGVLYIETDGAMLHTREKDEKGSVWRESKLGMVFATDSIISWKTKNGGTERIIGKREYITYVGEADEFKRHLYAVALRNGYGQYEQTVLLSDGATWIRNMKEELFPDALQILDLFHLSENTTAFAKAVFDIDENRYKPWSDKVIALFKKSKIDAAIEEIKSLGKAVISKSSFNLLGYIENNRNDIDYVKYRSQGLFIGSDAIESANRSVLQERLKRPGMRWNKESGQFILSLMSKAKSDMSRKGRSDNGVWKRDVDNAVREKYEVSGYVHDPGFEGPFKPRVE